jgi:hypothetical protein
MRHLMFSLALGLVLGVILTARAASLDHSGTLHGWFVEIGGTIVCESPYVFADRQTIWCR